jgi:DNA-binding MarR family transcriptional regulator
MPPPGPLRGYGDAVAADGMAAADLEAAWQWIMVGAERSQRCIERALTRAGVPADWSPVLRLLLTTRGHRLPMSVLAREVTITPGGFTKLADRMARAGVIDRRSSTDDRRIIHAVLTDDGLLLARKARNAHRRALKDCVLTALRGEQLAAASAVMHTLAAAHQPDHDPAVNDSAWTQKRRGPASPERRGQGHAGR